MPTRKVGSPVSDQSSKANPDDEPSTKAINDENLIKSSNSGDYEARVIRIVDLILAVQFFLNGEDIKNFLESGDIAAYNSILSKLNLTESEFPLDVLRTSISRYVGSITSMEANMLGSYASQATFASQQGGQPVSGGTLGTGGTVGSVGTFCGCAGSFGSAGTFGSSGAASTQLGSQSPGPGTTATSGALPTVGSIGALPTVGTIGTLPTFGSIGTLPTVGSVASPSAAAAPAGGAPVSGGTLGSVGSIGTGGTVCGTLGTAASLGTAGSWGAASTPLGGSAPSACATAGSPCGVASMACSFGTAGPR